jgi:hypothetical protein
MILKCLVSDGPGPKTNATKAQRHQEFNEYFPLCLGVFVAISLFIKYIILQYVRCAKKVLSTVPTPAEVNSQKYHCSVGRRLP